MYNPYKRLTAQLLLFSLLLESCYNPHIGVSKKTLPTPKGATYQQHQYKENTYSKKLEPPTSLTYTTADGQAITFTHHNQAWQAEVCMPNGRRQVPVTFEPGYTIEDLVTKGPTEQQQLIHVCPNRDNTDHVYIGKVENNEQYINKIITKQPKDHPQPVETRTQEQADLRVLSSPVQITKSPNSQDQASSIPLPIPSSEPFDHSNAQNTHNNAHKTPNKRTPSLKNQAALAHSQRAAQIKRAERTARAKPLDEPAPTAHLKQTTPPTTPQLPTPAPFPSPAAKASQDITSPIFQAQGGQCVHFIYKNDQWQASVREQIGMFSRTEVLPVFCERYGDIAAALQALQGKPDKYVQQRIHVVTARQVPYVPKFVFIGEQSLKGGGDSDAGPFSSEEPQGGLPPAGEDAGASSSGQSQPLADPQDQETSLRTLQARLAQGDIESTRALVDSLNAAQTPAEQQALQQWIEKYITWFNGQAVGHLTQQQGVSLHEYRLLADIRADNPKNKQLLIDYFNSLCNRIGKEYQHGEEPLLEALEYTLQNLLEYTLQNMDSQVFEGNPEPLIQLGNKLLAKLDLNSNEFIKANYSTHCSRLSSLHHTLVLIKLIDPGQWDPERVVGLYNRVRELCRDIAQAAKYYPICYHARFLKQSLQHLERSQELSKDIRRRVGHGLKAIFYLYQGAPIIPPYFKPNLDNLLDGCKHLKASLTRSGIKAKPWYDRLLDLSNVTLLTLQDSDKKERVRGNYEKFEELLQEFKTKEKVRGKDYIASRFGIVQQLRLLALKGPTDQVRQKSIGWLEDLAKPGEGEVIKK